MSPHPETRQHLIPTACASTTEHRKENQICAMKINDMRDVLMSYEAFLLGNAIDQCCSRLRFLTSLGNVRKLRDFISLDQQNSQIDK